MRVAEITADRSHAVRLKVGTVIAKDKDILSYGYNGTPAGEDNCCEYVNEDGTLTTKPCVIHAEDNALRKLKERGVSAVNTTVFVTHAPCLSCSKLLIDSGVKEVFYGSDYRSTDGIENLISHGINCTKYEYAE